MTGTRGWNCQNRELNRGLDTEEKDNEDTNIVDSEDSHQGEVGTGNKEAEEAEEAEESHHGVVGTGNKEAEAEESEVEEATMKAERLQALLGIKAKTGSSTGKIGGTSCSPSVLNKE